MNWISYIISFLFDLFLNFLWFINNLWCLLSSRCYYVVYIPIYSFHNHVKYHWSYGIVKSLKCKIFSCNEPFLSVWIYKILGFLNKTIDSFFLWSNNIFNEVVIDVFWELWKEALVMINNVYTLKFSISKIK